MKITQDLLQALCNIAQAAGNEIMALCDQGGAVWQKENASPLTEADLRADAVIRQGLETAFPGMFILSKESCSVGDQKVDLFCLVDPLDGTKEFLKRNGEFTVNIALVQRGVPVAGVVYAPALSEMFYAARGQGAFKQSLDGVVRVLKLSPWIASETLRMVGSCSHGGANSLIHFCGSRQFTQVLPHSRRPASGTRLQGLNSSLKT